MIPDKKEAFVTLATNDTYSLGCLVLGNSLRRVNTTRKLVVMVSTGVTNPMRTQLAQVFDVIQEVDVLDSNDPINLSLLGRPDLNVTFTKLHCWRLTQFEKAVFLDADTLVLQNVDELFDREELSAAPDAGWPDCFNSGVFVFKPSLETYQSLLDFATSQGSFDGGDQGLLNMYFKNWATEDISKHLPFIYNVVSQAFYSYLPAFTQFKDRVKIVHFIGAVKPWHHTFDTNTKTVQPLPGTGHSQEFLQVWWNIFVELVQPYLDPSLKQELTMTLFAPWPPPVQDKPEQNKGGNQSNETVETKVTTVQAVFPYKPPDVGEVFYEVEKDEHNGTETNENNEKIVEITVIPRSYSELESHYAEEPISQINPANPPPATYSAPWITEGWEKGTKGPDPKPPHFTMAHKSEETNSTALKTNSETVSKENSINETKKQTTSPESSEEQNSPMGLVGELASMTILSPPSPPSPVSDAQRKLNWERGQIDYLGQDSFENIQKKIDETLNTSAPAPAPTDMASPFTPKPADPQTTVVERPAQPVAVPAPKTVAVPTPAVKPEVPKPAVKPEVPKVQPKPSQPTQTAAPATQAKVASTVQPKVASTIQPKVASTAQPKVASTAQPKVAPATQPKVAPATQPKVASTVQPKVTSTVRPQATPTAKPTVQPGAAGVTKVRPAAPAPARAAAPTQQPTKTSGVNIQTSSKKK